MLLKSRYQSLDEQIFDSINESKIYSQTKQLIVCDSSLLDLRSNKKLEWEQFSEHAKV